MSPQMTHVRDARTRRRNPQVEPANPIDLHFALGTAYDDVTELRRGIGQSWARVMFGGSTGGWESLCEQIFYPSWLAGFLVH